MSKIIELKNVNKWFDKFQALKDVNLEVNQQEKIVICGPSGSGKSTLIRCINRLEEHQEGHIMVDGNEISENTKNIEKIRADVGMVFQQFNLFPHLSILDNCTLAPIWVKKLPKKKAEELAMENLKLASIFAQNKGIGRLIVKGLIYLGTLVAQAAASLVTVSALTLGIGTIVAIAAAAAGIAYLSSQTSKVGDLGIDPNGGPIVMSPSEGGIFQGTNNDGLSMGPGFGTKGGSGGAPTVNLDTSKLESLMEQNIAMNAEVAKRTGAESLWSKGNESLGNKANTDLKYGSVDSGMS
mgnify:CR=1 FL=1